MEQNSIPLRLVVVLLFLLFASDVFAQQDPDLLKRTEIFDSLINLSNTQFNTDSLKINAWGDSLQTKVTSKFRVDSLGYSAKIDSLNKLGQPVTNVKRKLDSLQQKKDALVTEIQSKETDLVTKTKSKITSWNNKVKQKLGIAEIPPMEGVNMPNTDALLNEKLSTVNVQGVDVNKIDISNLEIPNMPALDVPALQSMDLSPDLASLNNDFSIPQFDGLSNVQEKLGKAGEGISSLSTIAKDPSKAVEQSVSQVSEVKEVTNYLDQAKGMENSELMKNAELLKDPNAMKQEVEKQVVQRAVNHFAGREQALQAAMDQMAKYKNKFESLNSLEDAKKLPKNSMRGKSFRERFVPGVAFQFQKKSDDLYLDVNLYGGYKITGRLTAGAGWNQRITYSTLNNYFSSVSDVYGPRAFADVRIWKGFSSRFEAEWMNTEVPTLFTSTTSDPHAREWVFTPLLGIKKDYQFIKSSRGTIMLMFNLYNPLHKSPYGDLIYTRIGFEFPGHKKRKKDTN